VLQTESVESVVCSGSLGTFTICSPLNAVQEQL